MKIALLGKGKTGGKVLDLVRDVEVFDRKNPPLFSSLKKHDVILSFLPGEAFSSLIPLLIETKIPVVTASTGFSWPSDIHSILLKKKIPWIYGSNFAMGMQLAFYLIEKIARKASVLKGEFSIEETHHKNKLDAPSGTALHWKKLLGQHAEKMEITSNRKDDTVGIHKMVFKTKYEDLTVEHRALDRRVFAEGALFACERIRDLNPGLHSFYDLFLEEVWQ